MFVEIVGTLSAAADLYKERKTILVMLERLRSRIIHGTTRLVVFGAGGTGKTTLGRYLSGSLDTDSAVDPYKETAARVDFSIGGKVSGIVLVPPGQARRRANTWDELFQLLAGGKASGIINVVSWGYHATELELNRLRVYRPELTLDEIREAYRQQMLEEEVRALREIVPHVQAAKGDLWMITLVTKQDLWWSDRAEVLDYYRDGEYGELIRAISAHRGSAHFRHDFFSAALVAQNLATGDGHVLASTAAGYDDPLRLTNLGRFARALEELVHG